MKKRANWAARLAEHRAFAKHVEVTAPSLADLGENWLGKLQRSSQPTPVAAEFRKPVAIGVQELVDFPCFRQRFFHLELWRQGPELTVEHLHLQGVRSQGGSRPSNVVRLLAGFPFNVAANAGFLILGNLLPSQRGF